MSIDIQREVKISEHYGIVFAPNTEMGELYSAMKAHFENSVPFCNILDASLFYNLGLAHGIRKERARKRRRQQRYLLHDESQGE